MNVSRQYALITLAGTPYLLPFGQRVAERFPGLRLNEAGAFLWRAIQEATGPRDLERRYLEWSGAEPEEREEALRDLEDFLRRLRGLGALEEEAAPEAAEEAASLVIGPLGLRLLGREDWLPPELFPFRGEAGNRETQTVTLTEATPPSLIGARYLLRSRELEVLRRGEDWFLGFPAFSAVRLAHLSGDGSRGRVFLRADGEALPRREELFQVLRQVFLFFARGRGCFALHSASIRFRNRAWLFSAPSGTGKSTQAGLWQAEYGVPQLNGDLGLLSLGAEGRPLFHGMPWCGTSRISLPGTLPLGGIILLRQGRENRPERLSPEERQLGVLNRLVSPCWTGEQLAGNAAFAAALTEEAPVWRYTCTGEPEAARVLHGEICRYLEREHG